MLLDSETIDDVAALTALVSLDRIYGDVHQLGDAQSCYGIAHGGNLIAVGDDDAHCILSAELFLFYLIDTFHQRGYDVSLCLIDLIRR